MFRYFIIIIAAIGFSACDNRTQPAKQQIDITPVNDTTPKHTLIPTADKLIVPGISIGQTKLGENADSVITRLGKPDAGDAGMGKAISIWYSGHHANGYQTAIYSERQMGTADETPSVKQIRITSPWFVTREGIHVGSTQKALAQLYTLHKVAHYNQKAQNIDLYDTGKGITFELNPQNKCTGIVVYNVNRKSTNTYLPFFDNLKAY